MLQRTDAARNSAQIWLSIVAMETWRSMMTPLIHVVLVLIVVGVLLWLVNNYLPMASSIKSILNVVVIIAVVLWLLSFFGIWNLHSR